MAATKVMTIPEIPKREGLDLDWNMDLDALDLHIPHPAIKVNIEENGVITLTKADPHELQRKANKFRQGYKNWRQKKPFGARGEATDLKDQREEEEEEEGGSHARSIVDTAKANASGATVCHKFHSNSSAAAGEEAEAPLIGMRRGKSFSVSLTAQELNVDQEENWLKFYVNPFAELLDRKCQSLPLSTENLEMILQRNFKGVRGKGPTYDRSSANYSRICHVGVGGFHRSHQAVYTDELLEVTKGHRVKAKGEEGVPKEGGGEAGRPEDRWAICGIGLMVWDKKMYECLKKQDHMYTVLFRSQEGNDARVVGSILDFVFAPEDYQALFKTLAYPSTRIVSLTITEKGYCQKVDGNLNTDDVNVKHDLTDLSTPRTALGMLCGALDQRRREGRKSFTVLSCDNQPDNGHQLEKLVKQMAVLAVGEELKEWIEANTTFPNSMVDRITPATESVHKDILMQDFGVEDEWPVVAEHYGQWIVEDKFVDGRPKWEDVGVMFVPDVKPYEYMKLRLLNGTHSALSYVSHLSGFQFVDDALNCENIRDFVECYMDEVCASVPEVPGVDLEGYKKDLLTRFSNPYVKDKVERLMMDGSQKLRNTMRDAINFLSVESEPALLTTYLGIAVAAFIRYVTGIDQEGEEIGEVLDPMAEELREPARMACRLVSLPATPQNGCVAEVKVLEEGEGEGEGGTEKVYDPRGVITIVFGPEVAGNEAFVKTVSRALELICEMGMMYTLLNVN